MIETYTTPQAPHEFVRALQKPLKDKRQKDTVAQLSELPLHELTHVTAFSEAPAGDVELKFGRRTVTFPLAIRSLRTLYHLPAAGKSMSETLEAEAEGEIGSGLDVAEGFFEALSEEIVHAGGQELRLELTTAFAAKLVEMLETSPFHTSYFASPVAALRAQVERIRKRYDGQAWIIASPGTIGEMFNEIGEILGESPHPYPHKVGRWEGADVWGLPHFKPGTFVVGIKAPAGRPTSWYTNHGIFTLPSGDPSHTRWKCRDNTHVLDLSGFALVTK